MFNEPLGLLPEGGGGFPITGMCKSRQGVCLKDLPELSQELLGSLQESLCETLQPVLCRAD